MVLLLDLQLGESREHASARVLSTTNDEAHSQLQRENPIREVTDGVQEGNKVNLDVGSGGGSKEEAVDAESKDLQQKFDDVSGDMVCLSFFLEFLVDFSFDPFRVMGVIF